MPSPSPSLGAQTRAVAARVLDAVIHQGRSLKAELGAALPQLADSRDRALVEAISFAALRRQARYRTALQRWLQKPPGRRDSELVALLLAGLAQIDALQMPAHAALSATVDAARVLGRAHQAGLVNAILRRAQREGLPPTDADAAWPEWLRRRIRHDWPEHAGTVFAEGLNPAPMWLRVNRRQVARDDYAARLARTGLEAATEPLLADALRLDTAVPVSALPGFAEGDVSIQDGSAQQVADALVLQPRARVLDACAAPGGKAAHLLEREPDLRLLALDVDAQRLAKVRGTLERLKLGRNAQTRQGDASDIPAWWDGEAFDAVLLDAPCSATGIVRRQPDVLLHRKAGDIATLTALQSRLLDALWPTLRPGGVLVYTTCSILDAENRAQVAAFLDRTAAAVVEPLPSDFGHAAGPGRQRLPGEQDMDGFFYARIRKTDEQKNFPASDNS
ncbi:MAG: 16S rRNA (cytosine(967)-C(5))-methyltransferase RsmB [Xanthomonadaceae bacterium]|jgi:16S rRNA (cytosine967-C5)-methyltransferase|nr:16S rRNA (cytosine(967)-C(5))-methyltransferase RsmB [Xanthomonadaceae bacterium]